MKDKKSNYWRRKVFGNSKSKTEKKVYIEDQHPSTEEIVWCSMTATLTPSRGVEKRTGELSEVFCAVCCNKYLYILQFDSNCSSLFSSFYVFLKFLIYIYIYICVTKVFGLGFNFTRCLLDDYILISFLSFYISQLQNTWLFFIS
jgi:hypothetical protein